MTNINDDDIEKDFEAIEKALKTFNQEEALLVNIEETARHDLQKEVDEMAEELVAAEEDSKKIDEESPEDL